MILDFFGFLNADVIVFLQLILALLLGMFLGTERTFAGRTAGMRTYALVSLSSCLLVIIARFVGTQFPIDSAAVNPMQLLAGIVTGIGFLGAGVIFHNKESTSGLTTAAGIWVTSAIGIAVGYELYSIAIFTTLATLIIFSLLWVVEQKIKEVAGDSKNPNLE